MESALAFQGAMIAYIIMKRRIKMNINWERRREELFQIYRDKCEKFIEVTSYDMRTRTRARKG